MRRRDVISLIALFPVYALSAAPALSFGESDVIDAYSAIVSAGSRAAQVRVLTDVPSVGVVDMNQGEHNRDDAEIPRPAEFRVLAEKHRGGIKRLQKALAANPVTHAALQSHGVDVSRVVGVKISSGGSLRLYVI